VQIFDIMRCCIVVYTSALYSSMNASQHNDMLWGPFVAEREQLFSFHFNFFTYLLFSTVHTKVSITNFSLC